MSQLITRTLKIAILPKGEPVFSEKATIIEIDDLSAGEYLTITQQYESNRVAPGQLSIDPTEWTIIRDGIEMMIEEIRKHEKP